MSTLQSGSFEALQSEGTISRKETTVSKRNMNRATASEHAKLRGKLDALCAEAKRIYGFDPEHGVRLTTELRGRVAGRANWITNTVTMNMDAVRLHPEQTDDTLSHELAHLVAYHVFKDTGHGLMWRAVHRALGGNGTRCHTMKLPKARRTRRFEYTLPSGETRHIKPKLHAYLQGHPNAKARTTDRYEIFDGSHWTGKSELR